MPTTPRAVPVPWSASDVTQRVPALPPLVAELIGYSYQVAFHAEVAAQPWSRYVTQPSHSMQAMAVPSGSSFAGYTVLRRFSFHDMEKRAATGPAQSSPGFPPMSPWNYGARAISSLRRTALRIEARSRPSSAVSQMPFWTTSTSAARLLHSLRDRFGRTARISLASPAR
jgi:hypothetical protein